MADLLHRLLDVIEELLEYRHNPTIKLRAAIALLNELGLGRTMKAAAQADVVDPSEAAG
jgi:hypothetical protein